MNILADRYSAEAEVSDGSLECPLCAVKQTARKRCHVAQAHFVMLHLAYFTFHK